MSKRPTISTILELLSDDIPDDGKAKIIDDWLDEEFERGHDDGHSAGWDLGHADGYDSGFDDGRDTADD